MKTFDKLLYKIAYRYNINTVFEDFLQLSVFSMANMQENFNHVSSKYNKNEMDLFAKTFGALAIDCTNDNNDLLGEFYMEINGGKQASNLGQFFTPNHISDLIAILSNEEGLVCDYASGSSRNLIAHHKINNNSTYLAGDLDKICVYMSAINFILFNMQGYVMHMDALKNEIYQIFKIENLTIKSYE